MYRFGGTDVAPGELGRATLLLGFEPDGVPIGAPVMIVAGRHPGPRLWVQACIHGNEVGGTLALQRLISSLSPEHLHGTLICVMILNVPAFRSRARESPIDHANLNRVFPGAPRGRYSEQMAYHIWEHACVHADAFLDLHSAGDAGRVPFYAIYHDSALDASRTARVIAEATGTPFLWASDADWLEGALFTQLTRRGIPAVIVEVGGGEVTDHDLASFDRALRGAMAALGMLKEAVVRQASYTILRGSRFMQVQQGGILIPRAQAGDLLADGHLLAEMVDAYGDTVETVTCPFARGFVASMRRRGFVLHPGERVSIVLEVDQRGDSHGGT